MTDRSDMVARARRLAHDVHENTDKDGAPHIDHVARVAGAVAAAGHGATAVAVAWLHDTVEDTAVTLDDIERLFDADVRVAVDALTRRAGEDYFDYVARAAGHPIGRIVKRCDAEDNLARSEAAPRFADLVTRYRRVLAVLDEAER